MADVNLCESLIYCSDDVLKAIDKFNLNFKFSNFDFRDYESIVNQLLIDDLENIGWYK